MAVDEIHAEAIAPVLAPVGFVETFDEEHQIADRAADGFHPGVVFRSIGRAGGEQADDRSQRALRTEERAARFVRIRLGGVAIGEVTVYDLPRSVEVAFQIADEQRGGDHRVIERLGDL